MQCLEQWYRVRPPDLQGQLGCSATWLSEAVSRSSHAPRLSPCAVSARYTNALPRMPLAAFRATLDCNASVRSADGRFSPSLSRATPYHIGASSKWRPTTSDGNGAQAASERAGPPLSADVSRQSSRGRRFGGTRRFRAELVSFPLVQRHTPASWSRAGRGWAKRAMLASASRQRSFVQIEGTLWGLLAHETW